MRSFTLAVAATLAVTGVSAAVNGTSLTSVCTVANVQAALPANGTLLGINMIPSSVTAGVVYVNTSATDTLSTVGGGSTTLLYNYCNVTINYEHTGTGDSVMLWYTFPDPTYFASRFYVAGGEAFTLSTTPESGLNYGAVSGSSDAGYNGYVDSYDTVALYGNGSLNWQNAMMFSYQALGETTIIGKSITNAFYGIADDTRIYTYFEGCSDGGREAMSQAQRYGSEYDGIIAGAPAFRYSHQQTNHLFSSVAEQTMDYYPPPCELEIIVNATISACDGLDGRTDGVVSRTDLCLLNFNLTSIIGTAYYCTAENSTSLGFGFDKRQETTGSTSTYTPAQNGTVSAQAVALAQRIYEGMFNSAGERVYLPWQIASAMSDAETTYNSDTGEYGVTIPSTGGEWVARWIELLDLDNLSTLDNVTYDTLQEWMQIGMTRFSDSLNTNIPDLTDFHTNDGKMIHYHGESDPSVPPPSSVHYWESVLDIMYPNSTFNESVSSLSEWYRFFLVPGAAHCGVNTLQPGPYPENNMDLMIDWVENGVLPERLNATVSSGTYEGETQMLCPFPTRPYWTGSGNETLGCEYDQASIDSWMYTFDAFKMPVY